MSCYLVLVLCVAVLCLPALRARAGGQTARRQLPALHRLADSAGGNAGPVDTLPMSSALSRDGKYLLVLNGGYRPPSISVIDVQADEGGRTVPVPDGWLGLTFSPDGTRVYVGGGSEVRVLRVFVFLRRPVEARARIEIVARRTSQAKPISSATSPCRRTADRSTQRICITIRLS